MVLKSYTKEEINNFQSDKLETVIKSDKAFIAVGEKFYNFREIIEGIINCCFSSEPEKIVDKEIESNVPKTIKKKK